MSIWKQVNFASREKYGMWIFNLQFYRNVDDYLTVDWNVENSDFFFPGEESEHGESKLQVTAHQGGTLLISQSLTLSCVTQGASGMIN